MSSRALARYPPRRGFAQAFAGVPVLGHDIG